MFCKRSWLFISVILTVLSTPVFGQTVKNSSEPNFDAYLKRMQIMIKRHWYPPKDTHKSQTVVEFTINASGQLSNLRVANSSGDPAKDAAALEAVKQTVPYEMLPKGSPQEVAVSFSFDFDPKYALSDPRNKPQIVQFMGSKVEVSNPSASQESK